MQKYRADIDGLRAIAVVPVVLFHAKVPGFSGGFVGVDVFFVISGYLITSIIFTEISQGHFSILSFYERRIRRILPALFAVLIGSGIAAYFLLLPEEMKAFGRSVIATTLFASNLLFWREADYFDATAETKPLLHTWSLAVEEQFYIFFPVALALCFRFMPRYLRPMVVITAVLSFALCVAAQKLSPVANFYLPVTRVWELMIGALLALGVIPSAKTDLHRSLMGGAGLAAILASVFLYDAQTPFPGISALLPTIGTALVIHAGANGRPATAVLLSLRPVVFVGLVSYSFYLWHWPVLVFGRMFVNSELTPPEITAAVVASFALAVFSWHYVERPFRVRTAFRQRPRLFAAAATAMAVSVFGGFLLVASQGMPGRIPPDALRIAATSEENENFEAAYDCAAYPLTESEKYGPCPIGAASRSPSIAVWGDSHAMALESLFDTLLKEHSISGILLSIPGCPPTLGLTRVAFGIRCDQMSQAAIAAIKKNGIKKIIFVGSWNGILFSKDSIYDGKQSFDDATRLENVTSGLHAAFRSLHDTGVEIAFLMPTPGANASVPESAARAIMTGMSADLEVSSDEYSRRTAILRNIVDDSPVPIQAVVTLQPYFCRKTCEVIRDGNPLYFDGGHPSHFMNKLMLPFVDRHLKVFLESPRLPYSSHPG